MMQLFPNIEETVDLPPIEGDDWEALHYILVLTTGEDMIPLGVGDTISECKNNALANMVDWKVNYKNLQKVMKYIGLCGWNEGIAYEASPGRVVRMVIYLCESKVYIYARRYGLENMFVYFDTRLSTRLLRFASYDDSKNRNLNKRL